MTSRKEQLLRELRDLEDSQIEYPNNDSLDDTNSQNDDSQHKSQQDSQPDNNKVLAAKRSTDLSPKKPRSAKQQEVFARAQKVNRDKAAARAEEKRIKDEEAQRVLQEKIVKKAISIKKAQIRKEKLIEDVPDVPVLLAKGEGVSKPEKVVSVVTAPVPAGPVIRFY